MHCWGSYSDADVFGGSDRDVALLRRCVDRERRQSKERYFLALRPSELWPGTVHTPCAEFVVGQWIRTDFTFRHAA